MRQGMPGFARRRMGARRVAIAVLLSAAILCPDRADSVLRPLVRDMLENLGSINSIGEGIALDDFERVEQAAQDLKRRAEQLKSFDLASAGLDPVRTPQFHHFLTVQSDQADKIARAASKKDAKLVLRVTQRMLSNACVPCHANFREPTKRLKPSVLFMTTFLNAWKEMNRGIALNNFRIIEEGARELLAMGRLLSWEQIVESGFGVSEAADHERFHSYVKRLLHEGDQIVRASDSENMTAVLEASLEMWTEGCIGCHQAFR